jgi:AraC-like DNA-binding protein
LTLPSRTQANYGLAKCEMPLFLGSAAVLHCPSREFDQWACSVSLEPTDFAPLRFSTKAIPSRERLPFWREVFARKIVRVELEPTPDARFEVEATLRAMPGLRTMICTTSAARMRRPPEITKEDDESLALIVNLAGKINPSQRRREALLGAGDAVFCLHAEPAAMNHSQVRVMSLIIPRTALAPFVTDVEDAANRVIPHGNEALRLLTSYVKGLDTLEFAKPELRHLAVTHVHDLVAMIVGPTRDGAAIVRERGVRAARLGAVKADILGHLGRELTLEALAARQHVTPRYIQLLFEGEGITFSEFVLEQRLAWAHRLLIDLRHADATILAIAFTAGFGDISYFNRVFRRRYGATPSDVRAEARRAGTASRQNGK